MTRKVLFYCQHLLGVGHLARSLNICQELVKDFDVTFVQGGPDIDKTIENTNFKHLFLDPLVMNESTGELVSPQGPSTKEVWVARAQQLQEIAHDHFDVVVIELFPFGRKAFSQEILEFITHLRVHSPNVKVVSSVRDILVEKKNWTSRQEKIVKIVEEYFDYVLVHSDPSLIPFSATFPLQDYIQEKILYTGFITEADNFQCSERRPQVLVSIGGGIVGEELVEAVLGVTPLLKDLQFTIIKSPNMSSKFIETLDQVGHDNLQVIDFSDRYQQLLAQSELSISLSGYNTMMNLLKTKTFGLVFPYQKSSEQILRAEILQEKGCVLCLAQDDLSPETLAKKIVSYRGRSGWANNDIDLNGSVGTLKALKSFF